MTSFIIVFMGRVKSDARRTSLMLQNKMKMFHVGLILFSFLEVFRVRVHINQQKGNGCHIKSCSNEAVGARVYV